MKNIKVLGTGCAKCKATLKLIEARANTQGVELELEKIEELSEIMGYGVMSTPGVVIDGKVVHSGGVPSADTVDSWLNDSAGSGCCSGDTTGDSIPSTGSKCCG
ncbi:MAG TPA: thioredoxin family protein [Ectothiorhodospiraceae bacterium]|nr:thioredoxin family protein [Ectothiorhodospiraceae bacterium]